jgi:hypothetical protein
MSDAKAKGRAMGDGEGEEGSSEREENALPPKRLKSGGGDGAAAP